jgi:hypothetical protein
MRLLILKACVSCAFGAFAFGVAVAPATAGGCGAVENAKSVAHSCANRHRAASKITGNGKHGPAMASKIIGNGSPMAANSGSADAAKIVGNGQKDDPREVLNK